MHFQHFEMVSKTMMMNTQFFYLGEKKTSLKNKAFHPSQGTKKSQRTRIKTQ